ncbi:CRISPR-associated endonuclease Cas2 [Terrilactibacillus sp. BCM23-1]|uniref:CRISPR-associated endoribonuclease Cas2 n=1 Tax=Terrilactibacillus tamarindi TaxID=2599694 RepID=A0A6N8CMU7_9BACI|nr:CRISPR-associated endonuclease Cas2 [Terrilactibacillus tamarindi]MTT31372.1 CRISPR-associated endonuclease Cas2 [Terrilactibacillus tamarindi]
MRKFNANYVFLFYDVGEKRVNKVFKICKKYLYPYQNSVFRGPITPSQLLILRAELSKKIDNEHDFISIITFKNQLDFNEEIIGSKKENNSEDLFL